MTHPLTKVHPAKRPRLRWYQYSLRTLFLLTLIVSLLMSWHAVRMKRAKAQQKAVDAILAVNGWVQYDCQFDEQGNLDKGATGYGPAWLRKLLGPDYFDTTVDAAVETAEQMEAVNGLPRLKSLTIEVPPDKEDPLVRLRDIDGLEELCIGGYATDAGLDHLRGLKHLRRLTLGLGYSTNGLVLPKRIIGSGLAGLRSCPALRELDVQDCELSPAALRDIEALSQLEKLTLARITSAPPLVFHINKLPALRELTADGSLIVAGFETIENLSRLEKLSLYGPNLNISNSDVEHLCRLPALRELALGGCSKVNDEAVPWLQKMTGLRRLSIDGISDAGLERIDDALPNCFVYY
jgi:hypothetical protein